MTIPKFIPTKKEYFDAFRKFIDQSQQVVIDRQDCKRLYGEDGFIPHKIEVLRIKPPHSKLKLAGRVNRENATLALAAGKILKPQVPEDKLIKILNDFPGCWRRFEQLAPNLYTDYAHNPVKIAGCLQRAQELGKPVVVVYEPHSNQRQQLVKGQYRDLFVNVEKLYWLPTFLTREDPALKILTPQDLISRFEEP